MEEDKIIKYIKRVLKNNDMEIRMDVRKKLEGDEDLFVRKLKIILKNGKY